MEQFEVRDLREKNRFIVDDKFLNGYARFVSIYAVGVYNSLCRHANKLQKCWPSIKKISMELNIGQRSVIRSINYLEFWNIVKKERVGKTCNNRYYLIGKKYWKPLSDVSVKQFSEVSGRQFRGVWEAFQRCQRGTSNSKETQKKGNTIERKGNLPETNGEMYYPTLKEIKKRSSK